MNPAKRKRLERMELEKQAAAPTPVAVQEPVKEMVKEEKPVAVVTEDKQEQTAAPVVTEGPTSSILKKKKTSTTEA